MTPVVPSPSRWLHGPRRVVLLLLPLVLTAVGGFAAITAIERVREEARTEATIATVANSNATQVRQAGIWVHAVSAMAQSGEISGPPNFRQELLRLGRNGRLQMQELEHLVGDRPEGRRALAAIATARARVPALLQPPVSREGLVGAEAALREAAAALEAISVDADAAHHAAERRADRVTVVVLALAVLVIAVCWWSFIGLTGRMQRRHVMALEHLADHDPLTGLANRRALDTEAVAPRDEPTVVAVCDLDGFKAYNDRFGHPAGDALLQRLAGRLAAAAEQHGGRAFRLGGDEFCVVAPGADGEHLAALCREALRERGDGHDIGTSVGVALLPADGADLTGALHVADTRLYESKRARYRDDPAADRRAPAVQPSSP